MKTAIWAANVLGWPVIQLMIGRIVLWMPARYFAEDGWLFDARPWEHRGNFYRRRLAIHFWKNYLPDGAPWIGGPRRKRVTRRDLEYIDNFFVETRRAEFAHWCMLFCLPIFVIWNPPWACWVMALYAVVANLPCIVVQRFNRIAHIRLKGKIRRESVIGQE